MSHTIGPSEKAKHTIKTPTQATVTGAASCGEKFNAGPKSCAPPSNPRLRVMPVSPASKSGLRPTRSTSQIATMVEKTLTTPIPLVAASAVEALLRPACRKIIGA